MDEDLRLRLSEPDREDIEQEAALLRLLGKQVHRGLLFKKAQRQNNIPTFGEKLPVTAQPLEWNEKFTLDEVELEKLVDWAIQQGVEITEQVYAFLDTPTNGGLILLLKHLRKKGLISPEETSKKGPSSLSELVLRAASAQPGGVTLENLYGLARHQHRAKRPEAAIRQIIRRLLKEGRLKEAVDGEIGVVYKAT